MDLPWTSLPLRRIIRGKFLLSENYTPERHAFSQYNPRIVSADNPRKVKLCARISPRIRENNKLLLDIHQGPIRCCLMKKKETKKSHATVPFKVPRSKHPNK
jgi:hypothetical protein